MIRIENPIAETKVRITLPPKFRRRVAKLKAKWTREERLWRAEVGELRRQELYSLLFGAKQLNEAVA